MESIRLWLPEQVCTSSVEEELSLALVGWANVGLKSVDVVVAAVCPMSHFSNPITRQLQEVLDAAETKLPFKLRTEAKLGVIGQYFVETQGLGFRNEGCNDESGPPGDQSESRKDASGMGWQRTLHQSRDNNRSSPVITNVWARISARKSSWKKNERVVWVPFLRSLSLDGRRTVVKDHVIIYQQPVFGSHHFSCIPWTPSYEVRLQKSPILQVRKPQWMAPLQQLQELGPDMEIAMMELNCAKYIDRILKDIWPPPGFSSLKHSSVCSICCAYVFWSLLAGVVAVWATMLYALAQGLVLVLEAVWVPAKFPYLGRLVQRSMTWQTMHVRCRQLMAWPFLLLWGGLGPHQPNVAVAHVLAIARNSTWSVLVIDKIIGAFTGYLLLKHHASIVQLAVQLGQILTNDVLRTGCVWLMGVPAGFKLNNELAAAVGTLSLHAIQSWSTFIFSLVSMMDVFLHVLAITGFLLGFTVLAAIISDVIFLSTLHVSCLHHSVAFLHTHQLQALAALWRLFRGRKRNSLRGRVDTFDCSVEQLVVGSLMFTPLLLLLPTTSIYYTFFSMIFLTISTVQVLLHYMIAVFYCFPFSLLAKRIMRPNQFPSGIWFKFPDSSWTGKKHEEPLLSMLGIRAAGFAELLKPFLRSLWVTPELSSAATFVYKVVSGQRYNLKLRLGNIASLPHTHVSLMAFAWLCYTAMRGERSPKLHMQLR